MTCSNWSTSRWKAGNAPLVAVAALPVLLLTTTYLPVSPPDPSRCSRVTSLYAGANAGRSASLLSVSDSLPVCVTGLGKNTVAVAVWVNGSVAAWAAGATPATHAAATIATVAVVARRITIGPPQNANKRPSAHVVTEAPTVRRRRGRGASPVLAPGDPNVSLPRYGGGRSGGRPAIVLHRLVLVVDDRDAVRLDLRRAAGDRDEHREVRVGQRRREVHRGRVLERVAQAVDV